VLLPRRSLLTQEGICLMLEPDFRFLEVAYPYVAKRLLTDEDPALRQRLIEVLLELLLDATVTAVHSPAGPTPSACVLSQEAALAHITVEVVMLHPPSASFPSASFRTSGVSAHSLHMPAQLVKQKRRTSRGL
jgi:hypothetical protein